MYPFYFDYNATTPLHGDILSRVEEYAFDFGNPSSIHRIGRRAHTILEEARSNILEDFPGYKLLFTSSGTEANHTALQFLRERVVHSKDTILVSSIEHPCISKQMYYLKKIGYNVVHIPVLKSGQVDLDFISDHLDINTQIIIVMGANNETGVVQPIREISNLTKEMGIYFHCDISQLPGKLQNDYSRLDIESFTISAHKFYGLKGVGALLYRSKPSIIFHGGLQENELRAGTENLLGIRVMGDAYKIVSKSSKEWINRLTDIRDHFESLLDPHIHIVGNYHNNRLSNTSCILLKGNPNDRSVLYLDSKGYYVSRGAACHSGVWEPSPILMAMGYSRDEADTGIRISFGLYSKIQEVVILADVLNQLVLKS